MKRYRKEAIANGYRSKFELDIAKWLEAEGVKFDYEPCKLKYIVPESVHTYTPDWAVNDESFTLWESKGNLTAADRKKLLHVRDSNLHVVIKIVLQNASVKIRKGSKTSFGDWCTANKFEWCDFKDKRKLKQWCK